MGPRSGCVATDPGLKSAPLQLSFFVSPRGFTQQEAHLEMTACPHPHHPKANGVSPCGLCPCPPQVLGVRWPWLTLAENLFEDTAKAR